MLVDRAAAFLGGVLLVAGLACGVEVIEPVELDAGGAGGARATGGGGALGTGGAADGGGADGGGGASADDFELLVTSQTNGSVKVYDSTGALLRTVGGMLADPLDPAQAPDGTLLVSDGVANEIARFTRDGAQLAPFAIVGAPFGMTIADGKVYVCQTIEGASVRSFDVETGADLGSFIPQDARAGHSNDVAVRDGKLYVALWNFGTIEVFDLETRASLGTLLAGDPTTIAIEFGPDGDLYVAYLYGGVRRFDGVTGELVEEVLGSELRTLGIAFGPDGDLFVATGEAAIRRYDAGTWLGGEYFVPPGGAGLENPYHIAIVSPPVD